MTWILAIYIYASAFSSGVSSTLSIVEGFSSQAACQVAGNAIRPLTGGSSKEFRFICVQKK